MPVANRAGRLLTRKANTDAWTEGGPVFLPPTLAERLIPDQPPHYKETRSYVGPDGRRTHVITGDNNLGAVSLRIGTAPLSTGCSPAAPARLHRTPSGCPSNPDRPVPFGSTRTSMPMADGPPRKG
jgi:hypothetical protein